MQNEIFPSEHPKLRNATEFCYKQNPTNNNPLYKDPKSSEKLKSKIELIYKDGKLLRRDTLESIQSLVRE